MNDTRSEILRLADELVKSIGYNAFSYTDISKELHIKNAAIHYYFPSKSDLGIAVIQRGIELFEEMTDSWKDMDCKLQLFNYITLHDDTKKHYRACLFGSLALSYDTLPENMQKELQKLVTIIINWLTWLLNKGKEEKVFHFNESPQTKAYMIHASMLSALLMNKVLRNDAYETIQRGLLNM